MKYKVCVFVLYFLYLNYFQLRVGCKISGGVSITQLSITQPFPPIQHFLLFFLSLFSFTYFFINSNVIFLVFLLFLYLISSHPDVAVSLVFRGCDYLFMNKVCCYWCTMLQNTSYSVVSLVFANFKFVLPSRKFQLFLNCDSREKFWTRLSNSFYQLIQLVV